MSEIAPRRQTRIFGRIPNTLEAISVKGGITHCVRDLAVAHVRLQGARVEALVDQRKAGGMAQRMRVDLEVSHAGIVGQARQHLAKTGRRYRAAALGGERELSRPPPFGSRGSDGS